MTTVLAAIDGSSFSDSVARHAAWAAAGLSAEVELIQVLGRREQSADDRSGRLVAGARRQLLEELAALDAERSKLLMKQARLNLDDAAGAVAAGGAAVRVNLRHGDLLETLAEREAAPDVLLTVLGRRGQAAEFATQHLGSNLERILRAARKPTLIASEAYAPIRRFLIAFDGRPRGVRAVDALASSSLSRGLEGVIAMAGDAAPRAIAALEAAAAQLRDRGLQVETRLLPGAPNTAIPAAIAEHQADLLIMGAYGRSRLRTLVIGSTTSEMIRRTSIPILVHR